MTGKPDRLGGILEPDLGFGRLGRAVARVTEVAMSEMIHEVHGAILAMRASGATWEEIMSALVAELPMPAIAAELAGWVKREAIKQARTGFSPVGELISQAADASPELAAAILVHPKLAGLHVRGAIRLPCLPWLTTLPERFRVDGPLDLAVRMTGNGLALSWIAKLFADQS